MKFITCLLTLLLVALVSAAVRALDDSVIIPTDLREECLKKDDGANVVAAIEQFCKNTKIVRKTLATPVPFTNEQAKHLLTKILFPGRPELSRGPRW